MKLADIAKRIDEHLKRFEADPIINKRSNGMKRFYMSGSWSSGRYVAVRYVSYQGESYLSKSEAQNYLAYLNAGNTGLHFHMPEST